MAKTLEVKRFMITYKGEKYGPDTKNGPIIEKVDDKTAKKLIEESKGAVVEQLKAKISSENDNEDIDENATNAPVLPPIDPKTTNAGKK